MQVSWYTQTRLPCPFIRERVNGCPECANRHKQKIPINNRFLSYVKKQPNGCWEWQGAIQKQRKIGKPYSKLYGLFNFPKLASKAHRVSYWIF